MSTFKPRTATVTLYQGDYQHRIAEAEAAVNAAKSGRGPALMAEPGEYGRLVEAHNDLVAEAEAEGSVVVTLRALGRKKWDELIAQHPPRTDPDVPEHVRESDAQIGVNEDTFAEALVPASVASLSDDDLAVSDLLDAISSAQFTLIYVTAFRLNRDVGAAPKALSSTPSQSGAETGR